MMRWRHFGQSEKNSLICVGGYWLVLFGETGLDPDGMFGLSISNLTTGVIHKAANDGEAGSAIVGCTAGSGGAGAMVAADAAGTGGMADMTGTAGNTATGARRGVAEGTATGGWLGSGLERPLSSMPMATAAAMINNTTPASATTSGMDCFLAGTGGIDGAEAAGSVAAGGGGIPMGGAGMVISCMHRGHATRAPT
jgi:hypothetical protein